MHTLYCNIKCHYIQSAHIVLQYVRRKVLGKTLVSLYPVSFRKVASTGPIDKLSVGMDCHRLAHHQPISPMSPQGIPPSPPPPTPASVGDISWPMPCHYTQSIQWQYTTTCSTRHSEHILTCWIAWVDNN